MKWDTKNSKHPAGKSLFVARPGPQISFVYPPQKALVLCVDEKSQIQALDGDCGVNRRETKPPQTDAGADQARLHPLQNAKNKGKITPVVCETPHLAAKNFTAQAGCPRRKRNRP